MKDLLEKYSGHYAMTDKPQPLQNNEENLNIEEKVYQMIRNKILSGVMEPKQTISQEELAVELAVNPALIKESLIRLEGENLVNYESYKGFSVASFAMDDLKEIYFLRGLLEGAACRLAAKNLTEDELKELGRLCEAMDQCLESDDLAEMSKLNTSFHEMIYSSAKSPRLYKMITRLWNGFLHSSVGFLTLRAPVMVNEHKAIFEALRKRNAQDAEAAIQEHINSALGDLTEYWSYRLSSDKE